MGASGCEVALWKIGPITGAGELSEREQQRVAIAGRSSLGRACCWQMNLREILDEQNAWAVFGCWNDCTARTS